MKGADIYDFMRGIWSSVQVPREAEERFGELALWHLDGLLIRAAWAYVDGRNCVVDRWAGWIHSRGPGGQRWSVGFTLTGDFVENHMEDWGGKVVQHLVDHYGELAEPHEDGGRLALPVVLRINPRDGTITAVRDVTRQAVEMVDGTGVIRIDKRLVRFNRETDTHLELVQKDVGGR